MKVYLTGVRGPLRGRLNDLFELIFKANQENPGFRRKIFFVTKDGIVYYCMVSVHINCRNVPQGILIYSPEKHPDGNDIPGVYSDEPSCIIAENLQYALDVTEIENARRGNIPIVYGPVCCRSRDYISDVIDAHVNVIHKFAVSTECQELEFPSGEKFKFRKYICATLVWKADARGMFAYSPTCVIATNVHDARSGLYYGTTPMKTA